MGAYRHTVNLTNSCNVIRIFIISPTRIMDILNYFTLVKSHGKSNISFRVSFAKSFI